MIIATATATDKYPFTPASTLQVNPYLRIPEGAIKDCVFYPDLQEKNAYAFISGIYREDYHGIIEISGEASGVLGRFILPISANTELTGWAVDNYGNPCGSIQCDASCIPLFYGSYHPQADALVLLPQAFRPIPRASLHTGVVIYNGSSVSSITADGKTIDQGADGLEIKKEDVAPPVIPKIVGISLNGELLTGDHLCILCNHGGGRIVSKQSTITIGERGSV